jgi:CDP-diacylglycerol--glycerol-3-phosphate 3-phosphatidyltransferase
MNIPNALTILRIFFVPILVAALVEDNAWVKFPVTNEWLALGIFIAAAGTDLLDGYLARRWKQVTTVGTLLDPIADKLLISAALISLVQVGVLPGWMAILIVGREFAVSGLRQIAAAEGYTIKASDLGKTKMFSQVVAVSCMLLAVRHPNLRKPGMVLAQSGRTNQTRAAAGNADFGAQTAAYGNASEAVERIEQLGLRDNLEAAGSELNGANLALRPYRPNRFAV